MDFVGSAGEEFEIARGDGDVGARLFQRLAGVPGFECGEFFGIGEDEVAEPVEQAATFERRHAAPGAFEGAAGGFHRGIDIAGGAAGDAGELAAIGWADHRQGLAGLARPPRTGDQDLIKLHNAQGSCTLSSEPSHGGGRGTTTVWQRGV